MNRVLHMTEGRFAARSSTTASAMVFALFLGLGTVYIIASKALYVSALWATVVPLVIILAYAAVLLFARYLRLRDDQAGDNLYYLGFLYTLTSLGVSLWNFSTSGGAETIVTNFGVAVSSTILGVALRVIFSQMRQDPLEVERSARLQLAEAARRVRQELDATVFELSSFRRATQQSLAEGMAEVNKRIEEASGTMVEGLAKLSNTLASGLEQNASKLDSETYRLASTSEVVAEALRTVEDQLKAVQMPEGIIEIKLQPAMKSLNKALQELSDRLGTQVDQLQSAVSASTAATEASSGSSKAAADEQNRNLERIIALLSSHEAVLQRVLDQIAASHARTRERESPQISVPGAVEQQAAPLMETKYGVWRGLINPRPPAPPPVQEVRAGQARAGETKAGTSRWPWSRR
jgi:hypothetical protein